MEPHESTLYPGITIFMSLFENVTNCTELKKSVMSKEFDAALLNPAMVVDKWAVLTASNQAIQHKRIGKQITRTLHSEILYCLSPSKNITDSFRKFGVDDKAKLVLVVHVSKGDGNEQILKIQNAVQGDSLDVNQVSSLADAELIKKAYKVKDLELTVGTLTDAVISRIASKDL